MCIRDSLKTAESDALAAYQEAQNVRAGLEEQLAGMDPSDPNYSTVQQQLEQEMCIRDRGDSSKFV